MRTSQYVFSELSSCVLIFTNGERKVIRPESDEEVMMLRFRPSVERNEFHDKVIKNHLDATSVADLASKCGYNCLKSFTRHFKKHFNNTPHQWMLERRIQDARHYVLESELSMTEIAEICSFTNVSHFVNHYNKYYGTPPLKDRILKRERNFLHESEITLNP